MSSWYQCRDQRTSMLQTYLVSYDFSAYQIFHTPTFPCLVHTTDDWMYRCMRDTCLMLRWFITITPVSTLDIIMIVDVVQLFPNEFLIGLGGFLIIDIYSWPRINFLYYAWITIPYRYLIEKIFKSIKRKPGSSVMNVY